MACPQCHRTFNRTYDLHRHEDSAHRKVVRFFCDQPGCRRRTGFVRKDNLQQHLRKVHGPDRKADVDASRALGEPLATPENDLVALAPPRKRTRTPDPDGAAVDQLRAELRKERDERARVERELALERERSKVNEDRIDRLLRLLEGKGQ